MHCCVKGRILQSLLCSNLTCSDMVFLPDLKEHHLWCPFWMPLHFKVHTVSSDLCCVRTHLLKIGLCLEKRVFYRLISGLHASINVHLSAQYAVPGSVLCDDEVVCCVM